MKGAAQYRSEPEEVKRDGERENDDDRDYQEQLGTLQHGEQRSEGRLNGE